MFAVLDVAVELEELLAVLEFAAVELETLETAELDDFTLELDDVVLELKFWFEELRVSELEEPCAEAEEAFAELYSLDSVLEERASELDRTVSESLDCSLYAANESLALSEQLAKKAIAPRGTMARLIMNLCNTI